jgi:glyoxylase-like metal-dependent hydrolase (beta-lactamase superfamily II)
MMRNSERQHSKLASLPVTSFIDRRVNSSTILIIEDDEYGEHPHIYVKIYPKHLLIADTGCNTPRSKEHILTSLRQYLETYPLPSNYHQPLNPNGQKKYIILCSHCHFDHILGIPSFLPTSPQIIASSFQPSFILSDLPTHSLCRALGIRTPEYSITHWARHLEYLNLEDTHFRIQFIHIPGHTPDSLAWYDIDEHHLYVGDAFYERAPRVPIPDLPTEEDTPATDPLQSAIIFPEEGGNWIQYMNSLDTLASFITHKNAELAREYSARCEAVPRVRVSCGHLTYNADAENVVTQVRELFERIIDRKVPVTKSLVKRGVVHDFWLEEGSSFSVLAPRRLAKEAGKQSWLHKMLNNVFVVGPKGTIHKYNEIPSAPAIEEFGGFEDWQYGGEW